MVRSRKYTDAQQLAFLKQLKVLTPAQLLALLVFLSLHESPDRTALVGKVVSA